MLDLATGGWISPGAWLVRAMETGCRWGANRRQIPRTRPGRKRRQPMAGKHSLPGARRHSRDGVEAAVSTRSRHLTVTAMPLRRTRHALSWSGQEAPQRSTPSAPYQRPHPALGATTQGANRQAGSTVGKPGFSPVIVRAKEQASRQWGRCCRYSRRAERGRLYCFIPGSALSIGRNRMAGGNTRGRECRARGAVNDDHWAAARGLLGAIRRCHRHGRSPTAGREACRPGDWAGTCVCCWEVRPVAET